MESDKVTHNHFKVQYLPNEATDERETVMVRAHGEKMTMPAPDLRVRRDRSGEPMRDRNGKIEQEPNPLAGTEINIGTPGVDAIANYSRLSRIKDRRIGFCNPKWSLLDMQKTVDREAVEAAERDGRLLELDPQGYPIGRVPTGLPEPKRT